MLYLRFGQAIPFERLARLLGDLFGLAISEGALANILAQTAPAFRTQSDLIKARLLAGTALESDETSARVGKRTFWTWVFHHGDSACFVIRPSRGKKVVAEFLGDARPEFWVSDRFGAQMGWATKHHQACVAHMLRDARYAIDCGDDAFAPGLEALLRRAVHSCRRPPGTGRRHPGGLPLPAPARPRPPAPDRPDQPGRAQAAACRQALPPEPVRVRHQPPHPGHQQRLRAGAATLRRLPQGHQLLPIRMGR